MLRMLFSLLACLITLSGCMSDYNLSRIPEDIKPGDTEVFPDIRVTPEESNLGSMQVLLAESYQETFSIWNAGWGDLDVTAIYLEIDDGLFSLEQAEPRLINPNDTSTFFSNFHPDSSGEKAEYIIIESNDPDEPVLRIPLTGEGLAPQIEVDPMYYDYGTPFAGCPEELMTTITNVGTTNLEISRITYSNTSDLNFSIDETFYGEAPWILFPGEQILGFSIYEAHDEVYDLAYLTVESNDPLQPVVIASHEGEAIRGGTITDSFVQEETEEVDILFVIDNSCSMSDHQTSLATNAASFITTLDASGADYRLATITTDDPSFVGPVLYPFYPDITSEFESQLVAGTTGSATEQGLEMAYQSTQPGGDAESGGSFQRPDALLSIVFVTDEDDYSLSSVSTFYVPWFQSLKADPSKVLLHSVADDPYGTDTCGADGYRYEEATTLTGGIFSSICTSDWSTDLEDLADGSIVPNLDFLLSEDPIVSTIEVTVNGLPVTAGWTYDATENSVAFTEADAPEAGDTVDITYGYYIECP